MAKIPETKSLNASSVEILNAIRNGGTSQYRDLVPMATNNASSIREIGTVIMQYPALQNEFLSELANRIAFVLVTSKIYNNPWRVFKRGIFELGETIEEVFVNIAKPFEYDIETSENEVFKREIPDVRSAFHVLNYKKFYKATIQREQLRQAFLSWSGITDLISRIVDSMYTAADYDEFQVMKYLLARHILEGHLTPTSIDNLSSENIKSIVADIKKVSNDFTFMSTNYNMIGVANHSPKTDQFIIINSRFDAEMDVEVLAAAFNITKAEFIAKRVLVDGFGELDTDRLSELFANDPNYTALSSTELTALNAIPAVLVDRDFFMIFDNTLEFTEMPNPQGLYWNYWLHEWKTFSVSPFANATVFTPGTPSIDSVTVSPSTASIMAGQSIKLTAEVETSDFASKNVTWSYVAVEPFPTIKTGAALATDTSVISCSGQFSDAVSANELTGRKITIGDSTTVYTITSNTAHTSGSPNPFQVYVDKLIVGGYAQNKTLTPVPVDSEHIALTTDINGDATISVDSTIPTSTEITVTATSVVDANQTDDSVITVAS